TSSTISTSTATWTRCRVVGSRAVASPHRLLQELQHVGRQIVELGTAGRPADQRRDAFAQAGIGDLAHERPDLLLGLRTDSRVGKPGGDVLGSQHAPAGGVDLVGDLEAVYVVVHRVEEHEPPVSPFDARRLSPNEYSLLAAARAVQVGLHGCRDRTRAEERAPSRAVREARIGQVDPPSRVELPARERVAGGDTLGAIAWELGDLAGQTGGFD